MPRRKAPRHSAWISACSFWKITIPCRKEYEKESSVTSICVLSMLWQSINRMAVWSFISQKTCGITSSLMPLRKVRTPILHIERASVSRKNQFRHSVSIWRDFSPFLTERAFAYWMISVSGMCTPLWIPYLPVMKSPRSTIQCGQSVTTWNTAMITSSWNRNSFQRSQTLTITDRAEFLLFIQKKKSESFCPLLIKAILADCATIPSFCWLPGLASGAVMWQISVFPT